MAMSSEETIELIFSYIAQISAERSTDNVLLLLADMGRQLVRADRCTLWLLSKDRQSLWTKVAHGIDPITVPAGTGIVGHAIARNERLIINDVYADPRFNADVDRHTGYHTRNMLVVPMYNREGKIIGAFQAINRLDGAEFKPSDMRYILLASVYTAESIETSQLYEEIEATQREVVHLLGETGESRSKETGNHVRRVAEYSKILALAWGMDDEEAELLKNASPMHDLGKIAIPDAVLNKPGRFDEAERKVMDAHPELGYNILRNSDRRLLKAAAIVARQHHERWDGNGYPQGLKGEEIHIYGRITAIADVFDALGSDRVYKKAWPDAKTFAYFKEEQGRQFDPKLVDLFFNNLESLLKIREAFRDLFEEA